jgi:hypothetical protein
MSLPSEFSWFPFGELGEIGDVDVVPQSIITFSFNFWYFYFKKKKVHAALLRIIEAVLQSFFHKFFESSRLF